MNCYTSLVRCLPAFATMAVCAYGGSTAAADQPQDAHQPAPALWVSADAAGDASAVLNPTVKRSRVIEISRGLLAKHRWAPGDALALPMFDGASFVGVVDRIVPRSAQKYSLHGRFLGDANSSFTIAVRDGVVAGHVHLPAQSASYQIQYIGNGLHAIRELDMALFPPCTTNSTDEPIQLPAAPRAQLAGGGCPDDGSVIDLLVAYTPDARDAYGGTEGIEAHIAAAEADTNQAYLNSLITTVTVNVVATVEVDYEETSNSTTDRNRLLDPDDGYLDELHDIRDNVSADVVTLLVNSLNGSCGKAAFSIAAGNVPIPELGFNVVRADCAVGNHSFAHELGHNQGCRHDRGADNSDNGAFLYSHGYILPSRTARSIMAVFTTGVDRLQKFSNPNIQVDDLPFGVPVDQSDSAYNALSIINTAFNVANFRPSNDCNFNGICDDEEIAGGSVDDCNGNGRPDECDQDCNQNGVPDDCDVDPTDPDGNGHVSVDCDGNGRPDECDQDCNQNGVHDDCDIAQGLSLDVNSDGFPDECERLFVDLNATGANTGLSWQDAFVDLQDALALAVGASGRVREIWVAGGTYRPGGPGGEREATFQLAAGTALYAGFAGFETALGERDIVTNETILTGDLNGDDGPDWVNNDENSFNVVTASGTDAAAKLDGFTITGGNANGLTSNYINGAGMFNWGGDLTVVRCLFVANYAKVSGAGVLNRNDADATFVNCRFIGNEGKSGAGMSNNFGSDPTLINCVFSGNYAPTEGGAIRNGGVDGANAVLINCTLSHNTAGFYGGGIRNYPNGNATLKNCVLWGNTGGVGELAQITGGTATADYSRIQDWSGLIPGQGSSGDDPLLTDPLGSDGVAGTLDDNVRPSLGSSTIDAGNSFLVPFDSFDLDDDGITLERVPLDLDEGSRMTDDLGTPDTGVAAGAVVDIGAYEFVDCNGNGVPDSVELDGQTAPDCNGNGYIDSCDIATGLSVDCNTNGIPDECDIAQCQGDPTCSDCNGNGYIDSCDIAAGLSGDCNANGLPDECDIAQCQSDPACSDCNGNGIPDGCDIDPGDPDGDGKVSADCQANGIPDDCDIASCTYGEPGCWDCNDNQVPDACDIAQGTSQDQDGDGHPDECQALFVQAEGCRYLRIRPAIPAGASPVPIALQVEGDPLDMNVSCVSLYVQADGSLDSTAVYRTALEWGNVFVHGEEIIPSTKYNVRQDSGSGLSQPMTATTWVWGDVDHNGVANFTDVQWTILGFQGNFPPGMILQHGDVDPCDPNGLINVVDYLMVIKAWQKEAYEDYCTLPCQGSGPTSSSIRSLNR